MRKPFLTLLAVSLLIPWSRAAHAVEDAPSVRAQGGRRGLPAKLPERAANEVNLLVDVKAEYQELTGAARFLVGNGTQANHVLGGDKAYPIKNSQGTGVEFKKWGFIVNVLPAVNPEEPGTVSIQVQIELSGPVKSAVSPSSDVTDITTWQYQGSFTLALGQKTVIVETPALVEITVREAKR
jgi:hypothetical protein